MLEDELDPPVLPPLDEEPELPPLLDDPPDTAGVELLLDEELLDSDFEELPAELLLPEVSPPAAGDFRP